jgi:hypothetical protein
VVVDNHRRRSPCLDAVVASRVASVLSVTVVHARLLAAASVNGDASDAFARVNAGVMSPAELLSDANAERILAAAHSVVPSGAP